MSQTKSKVTPAEAVGPSARFSELDDGKDHINILFRKAATRLGHNLSHFTKIGFVHPYFGRFVSVEGFWFWIRAGRTGDHLRYLSGFKAKEQGRLLPPKWSPHFEEDIMAGNYQKIVQNEVLLSELVTTSLPFTHYYKQPIYPPKGQGGLAFSERQPVGEIKVGARGEDWMCRGFEDIRTALKEGRVPECWVNAEKRYINEHVAQGGMDPVLSTE